MANEQAEAPEAPRRVRDMIHPRFYLSFADDQPAGIKQFAQFCLILTYPAWLFFLAMYFPVWVVGKILYGVLWVLFWPIRAGQEGKEQQPR